MRETDIQQFMMRLSSSLRRARWLVVWRMAAHAGAGGVAGAPQSGHPTGEAGPRSPARSRWNVQYQLEDHFPRRRRLTAGAGRRSDATLRRHELAADLCARSPGGAQRHADTRPTPAGAATRPAVCRAAAADFNNTGAVDVKSASCARRSASTGDQPGQTVNGKVRLYVIGQERFGAAASDATKHDIAEAERWNLPIVLIVPLAVFGSLAAAAIRWRWARAPSW